MMYSEFIEMSGLTESYITHREYSYDIEPIYMECELTKQEFINQLKDAFSKIVYPVVENYIHKMDLVQKLNMISAGAGTDSALKELDGNARMIAYQYLRLYLLGNLGGNTK